MTSKIITISGKGVDIVERLRDGMESRGLIELFGLKFSGVTLETGVHAAEPFALMTAQEVAAVQPAPWTGEGLPPVGTVCEARIPQHTASGVQMLWCEVEILANAIVHGVEYSWVKDLGADGGFYAPMMLSFRPIKTISQIAAEEREAAIEEIEDMIAGFSYRKCAELVYDAGYRKGYDK